jgi:hypothetical protein
MTTGQRVGYFVNEWTVAIIGICILFAFITYYSDKSDWQTAVWSVAVGVACCVPFWVWKYFMVRRSVRRTTIMDARRNLGDIQGLDNLSQASTLSNEATHYTPPQTHEAPWSGPRI